MKNNPLVDLSVSFDVDALRFSETIKGHYSLRNQFERSATSMEKSAIASANITKRLSHDCGVIRRMLISSINTIKENGKT